MAIQFAQKKSAGKEPADFDFCLKKPLFPSETEGVENFPRGVGLGYNKLFNAEFILEFFEEKQFVFLAETNSHFQFFSVDFFGSDNVF